jgi:hypothetical protein
MMYVLSWRDISCYDPTRKRAVVNVLEAYNFEGVC